MRVSPHVLQKNVTDVAIGGREEICRRTSYAQIARCGVDKSTASLILFFGFGVCLTRIGRGAQGLSYVLTITRDPGCAFLFDSYKDVQA